MPWVGSGGPPEGIPFTLNLWFLRICFSPSPPSALLLREQDISDEPSPWKAAGRVLCPPGECQTCSLTWQVQCVETPIFQLARGFFRAGWK